MVLREIDHSFSLTWLSMTIEYRYIVCQSVNMVVVLKIIFDTTIKIQFSKRCFSLFLVIIFHCLVCPLSLQVLAECTIYLFIGACGCLILLM